MIGVIYEVLSANVKLPAELHSANVKRPAGLLISDPRVAAELPGCGTRSPLYLIGDAASRRDRGRSVASWTLHG